MDWLIVIVAIFGAIALAAWYYHWHLTRAGRKEADDLRKWLDKHESHD